MSYGVLLHVKVQQQPIKKTYQVLFILISVQKHTIFLCTDDIA